MSAFSAQVLFSTLSRERCVANLKNLPHMFNEAQLAQKKSSAVLAPLCVVDGNVSLLYTLRSSNLNSHGGQVSFPGGKTDEGETPEHTALRETYEELGISSDNIEIWSEMPAVQGRTTSIYVIPMVGRIIDYNFNDLNPSPDEVEEVFTVPLKTLCDTNFHSHYTYHNTMTPIYNLGKHKIWGITGFITTFLLNSLLPEVFKPDFGRAELKIEELMPSKL